MSDPILLVDDDPVQRRLNGAALQNAGFKTVDAEDGAIAMQLLRDGQNFDAILLDLVMPNMDGVEVMEAMKAEGFAQPVIVQTAKGGIDVVISAMRAGAFDFIVKPVAADRLTKAVQKALKLEKRSQEVQQAPTKPKKTDQSTVPETFKHLTTRNASMAKAIRLGLKAAASDIPVILEGETGVGKEVFARAIQGASQRSKKPFVTVNCGAIPENLVESTLFGHEKGSFTGATDKKIGKFVEADTGTLFLDEIGDLPLDAQVKLLRTLQEGEVDPVGSKKAHAVNLRFIAASHRNLLEQSKHGTFREDLYFRLNVFPIRIPSLRERKEDISLLVETFLKDYSASEGKPKLTSIAPDALALLETYDWPGNIRELQNTIFRAVVLCDGDVLTLEDFPQIAVHSGTLTNTLSDGAASSERLEITPPSFDAFEEIDMVLWADDAQDTKGASIAPLPLPNSMIAFLDEEGGVRPLIDMERDAIEMAIEHCKGQMSDVARKLGIGRSTLYRKFQDLDIDPKGKEASN